MIIEDRKDIGRANKTVLLEADLIISGGGMSGVCASITAAREGLKVVLVQDRPVLGGNASSEVRLWILGATSHMGNNNRWAREGGVIDELLVENLYRNKEGNALIFDTILLEKVTEEPNITLLLNTAVYEVLKKDARQIKSLKAFCSQNSTSYILESPLFCDATGDGIVSFLSGASFRMGAEKTEEFGELFAPDESYGQLLGHSLYFYSKEAQAPVKYVAPSYALKDIKKLSNYKIISKEDQGCRFWWVEYGGRRDTVHETEEIKWELWKVVYGIWDHIKNSGEHEDVDNLTLEWVGTIPGKRESRRFEGHYMMKQQDVVEQRKFYDTVAFGGWALDLHPADGVYSEFPSCTQYHSKGVYQIPLRSFISKDIDNLFFAGRIISASHVAFGSTRVMATCAHGSQAVAMAAKQCIENKVLPPEILDEKSVREIQQKLNYAGQSIPEVPLNKTDLLNAATINCSSVYKLDKLSGNGSWTQLSVGVAQLLPLEKDTLYTFSFQLKAAKETSIQVELRTSERLGHYTPDKTIERKELSLKEGEQTVEFSFEKPLDADQYAFITFLQNKDVSILNSELRMTGLVTVFNGENKAVNNSGIQTPPNNSGIDSFEFWIPKRRPGGQNLAFSIKPALNLYKTDNLTNGYVRPYLKTNAWAADLNDADPTIEIEWTKKQKIKEIKLFLDTDYDNALESVLRVHPENTIPFCVQNISVFNEKNELLFEKKDNHQTMIVFNDGVERECEKLVIRLNNSNKSVPVSIFQVCIV